MSRHRVTRREFDTILAALRLSQHDSAWIADGDGMIRNIAEEHGDALTNAEINALCEKLNLDGAPNPPNKDIESLSQQLQFCIEQLRECMGQCHSQVWANANAVVANAEATLAELQHPNTDQHHPKRDEEEEQSEFLNYYRKSEDVE